MWYTAGRWSWVVNVKGLRASSFLPSHPHDRDISFIVVSILRYLLFPGGHSVKFAYSLQFDWPGECKHRISFGSAKTGNTLKVRPTRCRSIWWEALEIQFVVSTEHRGAMDCSLRSQIIASVGDWSHSNLLLKNAYVHSRTIARVKMDSQQRYPSIEGFGSKRSNRLLV